MWACTRPLQSVRATAELVCRGRVVVLVSIMSTAAVGCVILLCIIVLVLHINPNPTRYQVITYQIRFEPLFATSSLDHSEARNDQGRRVKLEF